MSVRRGLAVTMLVLTTLGALYLTYVAWLLAGLGRAMDDGGRAALLNGYAPVVVSGVATLAIAVLTATRGRPATRPDDVRP